MADGILVLTDVYETLGTPGILYELLKERDIPTVGISHREMPAYDEHFQFVASRPYLDWCLIQRFRRPSEYDVIGAVYLTYQNEIGVQIFRAHQRRGYGEWAVTEMMTRHPEVSRFLANINPRNDASLALFRKLGFFDCQVTLQFETSQHAKGIEPEDDAAG